eukprot:15458949-Alexandrium_andersonii.AAC.1
MVRACVHPRSAKLCWATAGQAGPNECMSCPAVRWRAALYLVALWTAMQCRACDVQCARCAQSSACGARCSAHFGVCNALMCTACARVCVHTCARPCT